MRIVFMGSAEFGLPALEMLTGGRMPPLHHGHEVVAVVSTPARAKGRGLKLFDSPVTEFAKTRGLAPILTPEDLRDPEFISELTALDADLFIVVAFRILHKDVYSIPKFGTVNIHASLLPKYRGAAPIHRAIEAGERETGVTIFRIDDGIDTGEILTQKKLSVGDNETTPELYERLSVLGAETLLETIGGLERGDICAVIQDVEVATRAPKLSKQEGHIDWNMSAADIFNRIRAFKPFPGTYFFVGGKRVNVDWAEAVSQDPEPKTPGSVLAAKGDHIDVLCGDGNVLKITKVKPEGRPSMDVKAFLLGHTITEGTVLE